MNVWDDECCRWVEYTIEELDQYFHFVSKPNWENVREVYLMGSGANTWLRLIPKSHLAKSERVYNKVHGTYVEQ